MVRSVLWLSALWLWVAFGAAYAQAAEVSDGYVRLDFCSPSTPYLAEPETSELRFNEDASRAALGKGWRDVEGDDVLVIDEAGAAWAASIEAEVHVNIVQPGARTLSLEIQPFVVPNRDAASPGPQQVRIAWNGTFVGECDFGVASGPAAQPFSFAIPEAVQRQGENTLLFLSRYAVSEKELLSSSTKAERRAFGLRSLRLAAPGMTAAPNEAATPALRREPGLLIQRPNSRVAIPFRVDAAAKSTFVLDAREYTGEAFPASVSLRVDSPAGVVERPVLAGAPEPIAGQEVRVDLSPYANQIIEVVFLAGAGAPEARVRWKGPRVQTDATAVQSSTPHPPAATPHFKNTVVIVLDALRSDSVGCYGYWRDTTPIIDSLATQGVRFDRVYATAPYTLCAVWGLFTGSFPFQHGAIKRGIQPAKPTISQILDKAGIATGFVTANPMAGLETGHGLGFGEVAEAFENLKQNPAGDPHLATERAVDFIQRHAQQRFFLYAHYRQPHHPYKAPEPYFNMFTADPAHRLLSDSADWHTATLIESRVLTREQNRELKARYDENIRAVDAEIYKIVESLESLGILDDTLLVITSDHGEGFGEHSNWYSHSITVYDVMMRVPLVLSGKGLRERLGPSVSSVASSADLLPTVCDLMGITPSETPVGESLITKAAKPDSEGMVRAYGQGNSEKRGSLTLELGAWLEGFWWPQYKLIRDQAGRPTEVYDLATDPGETRNLAGASPVLTDFLAANATAWKENCTRPSVPMPAPHPTKPSQEIQEAIQALGYLSPSEQGTTAEKNSKDRLDEKK